MSKTDKKQWRGPFGMNAADVVVVSSSRRVLLSSALLFCIAVAMLLGK